MTLLSKSKLS